MSKNILIVVVCLLVIIIIGILNSVQAGLTVTTSTISTIGAEELRSSDYNSKFILQTINIDNNYFMTRNYLLPKVRTCLYNTETKQGRNVNSMYQTDLSSESTSSYNRDVRVEVGAYTTKTVKLTMSRTYYSEPDLTYDTLLIMPLAKLDDDLNTNYNLYGVQSASYRYINCNDITSEQYAQSTKIDII